MNFLSTNWIVLWKVLKREKGWLTQGGIMEKLFQQDLFSLFQNRDDLATCFVVHSWFIFNKSLNFGLGRTAKRE